jgi:RNA polymerase sigma-70 factor (ECF subfamily)
VPESTYAGLRTDTAGKIGFRARQVDDAGRQDEIARAVSRAKEGDREALRYLYTVYADAVYGYVRSVVRDDYEAEDVTQQVFMKIMTVLPRYEARDVPFTAWILRVARNVAVDFLRQRRAIPTEEIYGADETYDEANSQRLMLLQEALGCLPKEQRDVVILRHIVGLSPGEIAERLGKSEYAVHGLHHRGRQRLKKALVNLDAQPRVKAH